MISVVLVVGDGDCAVTVTEESVPAKNVKVSVVLVCLCICSVFMCCLCRVKNVFVPRKTRLCPLVIQSLVIVTVVRKLRYV